VYTDWIETAVMDRRLLVSLVPVPGFSRGVATQNVAHEITLRQRYRSRAACAFGHTREGYFTHSAHTHLRNVGRVVSLKFVAAAAVLILFSWHSFAGNPMQPELGPQAVRALLLASVSTKFSRPGDLVSLRVLDPSSLRDAFIEGEIHEVRASHASGARPVPVLTFTKLRTPGAVSAVRADLIDMINKRGQKGVDDEGATLKFRERTKGSKQGLSALTNVFSRSPHGAERLSTLAGDLPLASGATLILIVQFLKHR